MNYIILTSCVLCGWAMLRMMGSERSQMLRELEIRLWREAKKAAHDGNAEHSATASPSPAAKPPVPAVDKANH